MAHKHYGSKEVFCGIRFQANIKIWTLLSKNQRVRSNNGVLLPVAVKYVNRKILGFTLRDCCKTLLMVLGEIWMDYLTSLPSKIIRKPITFDDFKGGGEVDWFAWTCLVLEATSGNGF